MKRLVFIVMAAFVLSSTTALVQAEHTSSKTGTGPGSLKVSDPVSNEWLVTAGVTACQPGSTSLPGHCSSAGAGGVIFDVSDLQTDGKSLAVLQGNLTVDVGQCNSCGLLNVTICTDRDDDGFCTNVDGLEGDSGACGTAADHKTSCAFDDQWAEDELSNANTGDSMKIAFCFAHDSDVEGLHNWDSWAIFLATSADNAHQGTVTLSLSDVSKVGDTTDSCSNLAKGNTVGTDSRP